MRKISQEEMQARLPRDIKIIGPYINTSTKCLMHCNVCGHEWETPPGVLAQGHGCPKCASIKNGERCRLSVHDVKSRLPENIELTGEYINCDTHTEFICKVCGETWSAKPTSVIHLNTGCPYCSGKKVIPYKTDVFTLRPDVAKYFVDEEDAHRYGPYSSMSVDMRCDRCGKIRKRQIANTSNQGFSCTFCGDGISYPNKFVRSVLDQLHIDFTPEFQLGGKRYDNYFEYHGRGYLIEVDGVQHFTNKFLGAFGNNDLSNDKEKDKIAQLNGYTLIRIDARESEVNYLAKSINASMLAELYDITQVDYRVADMAASSSYICLCADLYNKDLSSNVISNIANSLGISTVCVRQYLHRATELNLCNYSPAASVEKILYSEELDRYYKSITVAARSIGVSISGIRKVLSGKQKRIKGLSLRVIPQGEARELYHCFDVNGIYDKGGVA